MNEENTKISPTQELIMSEDQWEEMTEDRWETENKASPEKDHQDAQSKLI